MYSPIQDGIDKKVTAVRYVEAKPPTDLSSFVHCFWEMKTEQVLDEDFQLHALPDACVNVLFNQVDVEIAGITALRTSHEMLSLGRSFHYVGIQLLPGVWKGKKDEIFDRYVGEPYVGQLPLIRISKELSKLAFAEKQAVMSKFVRWCTDEHLVIANPLTEKILTHLDAINTVEDMAQLAGISSRQLQRTLKSTTGFTPHDLLKILRLQQSFKQHYLDLYSDQSHFIHSFRKITGYTPAKYTDKVNV
jgi:AraC-like DNA-binding protein